MLAVEASMTSHNQSAALTLKKGMLVEGKKMPVWSGF